MASECGCGDAEMSKKIRLRRAVSKSLGGTGHYGPQHIVQASEGALPMNQGARFRRVWPLERPSGAPGGLSSPQVVRSPTVRVGKGG